MHWNIRHNLKHRSFSVRSFSNLGVGNFSWISTHIYIPIMGWFLYDSKLPRQPLHRILREELQRLLSSRGCRRQGWMVHLHIPHIWALFNHAGAFEKGCAESAVVYKGLMIVGVKFCVVWLFFTSHLNGIQARRNVKNTVRPDLMQEQPNKMCQHPMWVRTWWSPALRFSLARWAWHPVKFRVK